MPAIIYLGALAVSAGVTLLIFALVPSGPEAQRLITSNLQRGEVTSLRQVALAAPTRERAVKPLVATLAGLGRRFSPAGSITSLERKFVLAGRPAKWSLERLLAAKIILGLLGLLLLASVVSAGRSGLTTLIVSVLAVLLYFIPDVIISSRASERQRAILYDLPDVLDQMTICMEAGLGFEAAMARTSGSNEGPLSQELVRMLQEIQVGIGRREALHALADRNDVPDLRHFVTAMQQAETYGVPIARVLHDQADELRAKRRQRAEETARKLPLKLLIPLVLFVLPPLFIVLVGPAALTLAESFTSL
jgi:tight adherence protein C